MVPSVEAGDGVRLADRDQHESKSGDIAGREFSRGRANEHKNVEITGRSWRSMRSCRVLDAVRAGGRSGR
jgi:hypothetical protein